LTRGTVSSSVAAGQAARPGRLFPWFLGSLPDHLAARDLHAVAKAVAAARAAGRPVHLGMGAHAVKVGLAPVIIDLIRRGIVTALSVNGAVLVHDYECAVAGRPART